MTQRRGVRGLSSQLPRPPGKKAAQTLKQQVKTYSFQETQSSTQPQRNTSRCCKPIQHRPTGSTRRSPQIGGAVVRDGELEIAASNPSNPRPYTLI